MNIDTDFFREKVKTEVITSVDSQRNIFNMKVRHTSGTGSSQSIALQLSPADAEALRNQLNYFLWSPTDGNSQQ